MAFARLTYAPTAASADAFYIAGMPVADAFIGLEYKGRSYAVASSLELGNFRRYSRCDRVLSLEALLKEAGPKAALPEVIAQALRHVGAQGVEVGSDFPTGLFLKLKRRALVRIAEGALFPERAIKSAQEQKEIRRANAIVAEGIAFVADILRAARPRKGKLYLKGEAVTSERLRLGVQRLFLARGMEPVSDLIIAGGAQACDPHCMGFGPLRPRELIIVDLFAPLQKSRYWGDMTRTFIKGAPTPAQASLVEAVAAAHRWALGQLKPGAVGREIHAGVTALFEHEGYHTRRTAAGYEGFFHGTGHALGLECHDNGVSGNGLNIRGGKLRAGEVVTIEPGLYYRAIGGCRIEDNAVLTATGHALLSHAPYEWVI